MEEVRAYGIPLRLTILLSFLQWTGMYLFSEDRYDREGFE